MDTINEIYFGDKNTFGIRYIPSDFDAAQKKLSLIAIWF